jgi:hypothetical protein
LADVGAALAAVRVQAMAGGAERFENLDPIWSLLSA